MPSSSVGSLILTILSIYICQNSLYDRLDLVAISDGDNLIVAVPVTYSDTFKTGESIALGKETYHYSITSISEMQVDLTQQLNYQNFSIKIDKKYPQNQILKITLYYNKEKIIKKVIKLIKEWCDE